MNELNRTDSQQIDPQKKESLNNKPTPEQINTFTNLLTKAKNSVNTEIETTKEQSKQNPSNSQKENNSSSKNSSIEDQNKPLTFKIKKDDPILKQIFNEMGMSSISQIDSLLVQVIRQVESVSQIPNTQQIFNVQLDNKQFKLSIETITKNNQLTVNLNGDKALIALLNAHLPELKKYLKKKNITIDNLNLIDYENKEQKNQTYSQNKK